MTTLPAIDLPSASRTSQPSGAGGDSLHPTLGPRRPALCEGLDDAVGDGPRRDVPLRGPPGTQNAPLACLDLSLRDGQAFERRLAAEVATHPRLAAGPLVMQPTYPLGPQPECLHVDHALTVHQVDDSVAEPLFRDRLADGTFQPVEEDGAPALHQLRRPA